MSSIRIATRRSPLALAQSRQVAAHITAATGQTVELVEITSLGDQTQASLKDFGGVGVFIAAVREAVLAGQADLAVHSMKDLPTAVHDQMYLLAVPPRAATNDVLISDAGRLQDLPGGATVGTGSPRRRAQLLAMRADLQVVDIRGNVDTRVGKVGGAYDAVLLAEAGLGRLGITDRITEVLSTDLMLPAPGQGALAIECATASHKQFSDLTAALDDPVTRAAVTAERTVLAELEAGCAAPMGAEAIVQGDALQLRAGVFSTSGDRVLRSEVSGTLKQAVELGRQAAAELLDLGASGLLGDSGK